MSRPHTCFIQSQSLQWHSAAAWGVLDGFVKTLSVDDSNDECTAILRLSANFAGSIVSPAGLALELLVLEGALQVDGVLTTQHGYLFRIDAVAVPVLCRAETTVLVMRNRPRQGDIDVAPADTFAMRWLTGADGSVTGKPLGNGLATKTLRFNAATGERSFLYAALAQHPPPAAMPGRFTHPMVEELFMLDGSYVFGDVGRMQRGAYVWWREHVWHGPAGSVSGYHLFIRVLGGPLKNEFSTEPAAFSYHPPYRPVLPAALAGKAHELTEDASW